MRACECNADALKKKSDRVNDCVNAALLNATFALLVSARRTQSLRWTKGAVLFFTSQIGLNIILYCSTIQGWKVTVSIAVYTESVCIFHLWSHSTCTFISRPKKQFYLQWASTVMADTKMGLPLKFILGLGTFSGHRRFFPSYFLVSCFLMILGGWMPRPLLPAVISLVH